MNGYELSRRWFAFAYEHSEAKPAHTALYFWIIERANASGWKKIIDIQTEKSMECLGITDWRTYKNALQFLADSGFIIWVEKSKNQYTCNRVSLVLGEGETGDALKNAYASNAEANAEAIAEAIAEAYAEAHVEAIAEALQSYINPKTLKQENLKTTTPPAGAESNFEIPVPAEVETTLPEQTEKKEEKSCAKKEESQTLKPFVSNPHEASKIKHLDSVRLARNEYQALVRSHGEQKTIWMIEKLNAAKMSKGYTYDSDYYAILDWVVDRARKEFKPKNSHANNQQNSTRQPSDETPEQAKERYRQYNPNKPTHATG